MNPYVPIDEENLTHPQRNVISKATQTSSSLMSYGHIPKTLPPRVVQGFEVQNAAHDAHMNLESEYQCYICWLIANMVLSAFGIFIDLVAFSGYSPPVGLLFLEILLNSWNIFHVYSVYTGIKERKVEKIELGITSMYWYMGGLGLYAFIYVGTVTPYYQRSNVFFKQAFTAGFCIALFYYTVVYYAVQIRDRLKPAAIARDQQERPLLRV